MPLKDLADAPAPAPRPITCPNYLPLDGSRRCAWFEDGGACGRPDEFMCVEWLRANGHPVPTPSPKSDVPFDFLNVEVCIDGGAFGEVWLVPVPTREPRVEVTPQLFALIDQVRNAFPGAQLSGLWRPWPTFTQPKEGTP